jgi:CHASE3 domain sensor protein
MKITSWSKWKSQVAFGSAILALLIMGAISDRARVMSIESDQWVRHTHEALESLPNLLVAMKTVESPNRALIVRQKYKDT